VLTNRKKKERAFYVYQVYGKQAADEARHASAIIFYRKALELDPSNIGLLLKIADLYRITGERESSLETYRRVLRLSGWGSSVEAETARRAIHKLTGDRVLSPGAA